MNTNNIIMSVNQKADKLRNKIINAIPNLKGSDVCYYISE